jgi:uncharacterized protein (DUF1330 family)
MTAQTAPGCTRNFFMTVYVVAQLDLTDDDAYARYRARFRGVLGKFDGQLLAADEQPKVIEGQWNRDKVVLLSFADEAAFRRFWDSPDYMEIVKHRHAGTRGDLLLVQGIS